MDGDEHLVVDDEVPPVNAPLSNTEVAFESSNSKWWHSLEDFRTELPKNFRFYPSRVKASIKELVTHPHIVVSMRSFQTSG